MPVWFWVILGIVILWVLSKFLLREAFWVWLIERNAYRDERRRFVAQRLIRNGVDSFRV